LHEDDQARFIIAWWPPRSECLDRIHNAFEILRGSSRRNTKHFIETLIAEHFPGCVYALGHAVGEENQAVTRP
jgi:hypothetical protein